MLGRFGLYDCFPVCFIRALEAVHLAPKGGGGQWVEQALQVASAAASAIAASPPAAAPFASRGVPPVNTHGGLLAFGAPWETPAMYNIIEAVHQLCGTAGMARQVPNARRALVYGNGGIFSHSAVAILSKPLEQ